MEKALRAARVAFEASFWKRSGLRKPRVREDDDGVAAPELTPEQISAISEAIAKLTSVGYSSALIDSMTLLAQMGYGNGAKLFRLEDSFETLPGWAYAQVTGSAKQLGFMVVDRERKVLLKALQDAIARGAHAREFAADIQSIFAEGYHVIDDAGEITRRIPAPFWSKMVARTELNRAANAGNMALYEAAKIEQVEWNASRGIYCCDECQEVDGEVVKLGDDFSVGVDSPPLHPNCACILQPADDDLGDWSGTQDDQDRAARGGYSADEYLATFGHVHPIDDDSGGAR